MMNFYYNYSVFLNSIENYAMQLEKINSNDESIKKIVKALKNTVDCSKSLSDLNQQEASKYLELLNCALASSIQMNIMN